MANLSGRFDPRGNPARGVSHMVSNIVPEIDPGLDIPLVCVFLNEYYPPLPSAARCAQLGAAIAEVLSDRPERIAQQLELRLGLKIGVRCVPLGSLPRTEGKGRRFVDQRKG